MVASKPHKIAVVDDDHSVRESLQFLLELFGHPVDAFASAAEFLERDVREVACLILDHHMPQMTGLELVEQLRADNRPLPTLLITGAVTPAMSARATELGIERVLEKPLNECDLLDFICSATEGYRI